MIETSVCLGRGLGNVMIAFALPLLIPRVAPCITGLVAAVTICAFD
jgi:hypothetical protein